MEDEDLLKAIREIKFRTYSMSKLKSFGWENLELFCEIFQINMKWFIERKKMEDKTSIILELRKAMRQYENINYKKK